MSNFLNAEKKSSGFSLLELIAAVAIIGILASICYAAMNRYVPGFRLRAEAKAIDSLFQKARLRAASSQKPVRVVINCTKNVVDTCVANLEGANYTGANVTSWTNFSSDRHEFSPYVMAVKETSASTFDGTSTFTNIFWAIFLPDSRVFSDPRPFSLFIYNDGDNLSQLTKGWRVSLSNDAGRVATEQVELTIS
jgi:prepilin-type N-terminal cleavage/methylation domain-containing protein